MLDIHQFRELVIVPALEAIDARSLAAEELLLGTALQESGLMYLKQIGGGPALGLFQMESITHDDIWLNYLAYRPILSEKMTALEPSQAARALVTNLLYAAAMCRVHYLRVTSPLPEAGDYEAHAAYWKKYYNTPAGAGTAEEYLTNWKAHVFT